MVKHVDVSDLASQVNSTLNDKSSSSDSQSGALALATGRKRMPPTRTITAKKVDAKRCRVWAAHDRDNLWFNEKDCADLIAGFKADGQQKLAVVRKINDDPFYQYEIIEGARRRWVAEYLDMPLEVEVKNLTDAQAAVMMESENADRQDISPFERALSYSRLLQLGVFSNQESLCEGMKISKAQLSKSLIAASLTEAALIGNLIKDIIPDTRQISIAGAYSLMTEWNKSEEIKGAIIQKANELKALNAKPTPPKMLKQLAKAPYDQPKADKKTYWHSNGAAVLTAQKAQNGQVNIAVKPLAEGVKKSDVKKLINEALADLL